MSPSRSSAYDPMSGRHGPRPGAMTADSTALTLLSRACTCPIASSTPSPGNIGHRRWKLSGAGAPQRAPLSRGAVDAYDGWTPADLRFIARDAVAAAKEGALAGFSAPAWVPWA